MTAKQIKEMKDLLTTPQQSPIKQSARATKTPMSNPIGSALFDIMQAIPSDTPPAKQGWQEHLANIREDLEILNTHSALRDLTLPNIPETAMATLEKPIKQAMKTTFKPQQCSLAIDSIVDSFSLKITKGGKSGTMKAILQYFLAFQTKQLYQDHLPQIDVERHLGVSI